LPRKTAIFPCRSFASSLFHGQLIVFNDYFHMAFF